MLKTRGETFEEAVEKQRNQNKEKKKEKKVTVEKKKKPKKGKDAKNQVQVVFWFISSDYKCLIK